MRAIHTCKVSMQQLVRGSGIQTEENLLIGIHKQINTFDNLQAFQLLGPVPKTASAIAKFLGEYLGRNTSPSADGRKSSKGSPNGSYLNEALEGLMFCP